MKYLVEVKRVFWDHFYTLLSYGGSKENDDEAVYYFFILERNNEIVAIKDNIVLESVCRY